MVLPRIGLYKTEKKVFNDAQSRAREWLKGILEMDKSSRNSLEFIENVKIDLFPDEVYVFTPKGKSLNCPPVQHPLILLMRFTQTLVILVSRHA